MNNISTVELHPIYPFIRFGLPFDIDPTLRDRHHEEIELINPNEWWLEISGRVEQQTYTSRENLLNDVESVLFSEWNISTVEEMINKYKLTDIDMALKLSRFAGEAHGIRCANQSLMEVGKHIEKLISETIHKDKGSICRTM